MGNSNGRYFTDVRTNELFGSPFRLEINGQNNEEEISFVYYKFHDSHFLIWVVVCLG